MAFRAQCNCHLPLPLAVEYRKDLGLSFSIVSGRAISAKGTFIPLLFRAPFWSGWAHVPTLRAGMWLHCRFCVPPSTHAGYCTWKELLEFSNFWSIQLKTRRFILISSLIGPLFWYFDKVLPILWAVSLAFYRWGNWGWERSGNVLR